MIYQQFLHNGIPYNVATSSYVWDADITDLNGNHVCKVVASPCGEFISVIDADGDTIGDTHKGHFDGHREAMLWAIAICSN